MKRWRTPDWRHVGWHYKAMHAFARPWHNPLFVRGRGIENVPREGACILAANHSSWWDPIVLGACVGRPVCYLGKREVFRGPFTRWFFGRGGVIPVDRNARNPDAMAKALEALRVGRVIGVFPEGTRHVGRLGPARPGAARLALQSGAPVVPAAILSDRFWGPGRKLPRLTERVWLNVGEPMRVKGDAADPTQARAATDEVMAAIRALLDEARAARDAKARWVPP